MRRLLLVLALFAGGCRKEPVGASPSPSVSAPSSTPEAAFWRWFTAHATEVAKIAAGNEPIAVELASELRKLDAGLTFAIGNKPGERELVISADGKTASFPAVKRVVAAAPVIAGWRVTAFRPRGSTDMTITLGDGTQLSGSDLTYRVLGSHEHKIDIELYVKGPTTITDAVSQAVFLLLDSALGEYDVETYLGGIEMKPASAAPPNALPLTQLPKAVDAAK